MIASSRYSRAELNLTLDSRVSIARLKAAGAFIKPKGIHVNWDNTSWVLIVVRGFAYSSGGICQERQLASKLVNTLAYLRNRDNHPSGE